MAKEINIKVKLDTEEFQKQLSEIESALDRLRDKAGNVINLQNIHINCNTKIEDIASELAGKVQEALKNCF